MKPRIISNIDSLIDWLAERLLTAQPRTRASNNFGALFDKLVEDLRRDKFSDAFDGDSFIKAMVAKGETSNTSIALMTVLSACSLNCALHGCEECGYQGLGFFVSTVNDTLRLGLDIKDGGYDLSVKSGSKLEKREQVRIRVEFGFEF